MKNKILVIGASGLIGRYLYNYLKKEGEDVIGTYNSSEKPGLVHFDIVNSPINSFPLDEIKYLAVCSGMAKMDECKKNPEYSNLVNVKGVKRAIMQASDKGIIPVYVSSASVFDGIKGGYKEDEKKNPVNFYGKQRADVEDFIASDLERFLIIRPGKLFGIEKGEGVLFTDWIEKYRKKQRVICADDEKMSPIYAQDLARGMHELMKKDSKGIYHINPNENYSRFELANKFFGFFTIDDAKIIRCSIDDFDFLEKRMKNSYLDSSKFIEEFNFKFTSLEQCFGLIDKK